MHFLEFNRRRDLREFYCYGRRGRINTWLFVYNKLTGIAHQGVLEGSENVILTKLGQHINEMLAVAVTNFLNFVLLSRFLIIKQIVNMVTNAISVVCPCNAHSYFGTAREARRDR